MHLRFRYSYIEVKGINVMDELILRRVQRERVYVSYSMGSNKCQTFVFNYLVSCHNC